MRLYLHRTIKGLPAWGVYDAPYKNRDSKLVATIIRLDGVYWATLTEDKRILTPRHTLRRAKREVSNNLPITLDF